MSQERLLSTAIEHFGLHGFEGASTRGIATAAGTAMSSITYHYGGKQGLYLAAADHIATSMRTMAGPVLEAIQRNPSATREEACQRVVEMLNRFAMMMIAEDSQPWARFIIREQMQPTEAYERLYRGFWGEVMETLLALVRRARPDFDEEEARITLVSLFGPVLALRAGRASVLRILDRDQLDPAISIAICDRLRRNALRILSPEGTSA